MSERLWHLLGSALYPRGLYGGPYWWRSLNSWWLGWWGWCFFYSKPWRPGSVQDLERP